MQLFGDALKEARKTNRLTLRNLSKKVGKSIGYLSDLEHNRKRAPKLDVVKLIEAALNISDGRLTKLASNMRNIAPRELARKIKDRPKLSEVLLRADNDLTESEFDKLMDLYEELKSRK